MAAAGLCHSDEHIRNGDMSVPNEVMESFGLPGMFPMIGGHEGSGVVARGRRWRHRVRAGRPRGDVVRRGLRHMPVVQLGHGVHLRHGRPGDDSRYADGRHLPPSHRRRPQSRPPVEGRRVLETHCGFHGFDRQDRPSPAVASDGAVVVRNSDRVRLRGEPGEGEDRRHGRRHRRRGHRYRRRPGCPHQRCRADHRGRSGGVQAEVGAGIRCHAQRLDHRGGRRPASAS